MPWKIFETAIGPCGIAWNDVGVTFVQLPEATPEETKKRLIDKSGEAGTPAKAAKTPEWITKAIALMIDHLEGRSSSTRKDETKRTQDFLAIPLDLSKLSVGSSKVYRALQAVPSGTTVSYGDLAKTIGGSANGARAIGRAMATNPFPILVPCHRVLGSGDNGLAKGGFSAYGGLATKERLLQIEGWSAATTKTARVRASKKSDKTENKTASLFTAQSELALPYDRVAALEHLTKADPILRDHLTRIGAFTLSLKKTEGTFAALAESIVYQQLNGKAAATIFSRVCDLFPKGRVDPRALIAMPDEPLRSAGLSRNKLAALRDLATRTEAGEVPTLAQLTRMGDDAIVEKLSKVRGIGRWTVEMLLIFRLGRPDVLPVADYGIKKGFARVFHAKLRPKKPSDELPKDVDLIARAERWRPFRSVASWYLWRAADS